MATGYVLNRSARLWGSAGSSLLSSKTLNDNPLTGPLALMLGKIRQLSKSRGKQKPPLKESVHLIDTGLYPYVLSEKMENVITAGDPQAKSKLQTVLLLLSVMREHGKKLPNRLNSQQFLEMIECTEDKVHDLILFYNTQTKNTSSAEIKAGKDFNHHHKTSQSRDHLFYHFLHNSLFIPFSKADQCHHYNTNLIQGLSFGQQIVFDCDFDEYMTLIEVKTTANHLNHCVDQNQKNLRPFGLHFCNLKSNGKLFHSMKLQNPSIGDDLPVNLHTCSYLDLFRREDIVYLSPHARREFEYHPNDVYILSALSNKEPLCVKKARKEAVRCFKLPLEFREMKRRSHLGIKEAFRKLLLIKNTGDYRAPKLNV